MKPLKKIKLWRVEYPKGSLAKMSGMREKLAEFPFNPIDDMPGEPMSQGFVSFADLDDPVDSGSLDYGSWSLFTLRADSRKPDAKVLNRRLEKELRERRREGVEISRKDKSEIKERIKAELMMKAEPIPALTPIYAHPVEDAIYYPAANLKKLEAVSQEVEKALELSEGLSRPDGWGEDEQSLWLEKLWLDSINGEAEFTATSVGNEASSTRSDDEADLAFGRINDKRCTGGKFMMDGISVEIGKEPWLLGIEIDVPCGKEMSEDELVMRLDMIADAFARADASRAGIARDGVEAKFVGKCRERIESVKGD